MAPVTRAVPWTGTRYGRSALNGECDRIRDAAPGFRTNALFNSARRIGQLVGAQLDEEHARRRLLEAGRDVGLAEGLVHRQVERGLHLGRQQPREPAYSPPLDSPKDVVLHLRAIQAAVEDPAVAPLTRRLLAGFVEISLRAGKLTFTASHRQVSAASGLGTSSIGKHLNDIEPWVSRRGRWHRDLPNASEESTRWSVHPDRRRSTQPGTNRATPGGMESDMAPGCADPERQVAVPSWLMPNADIWDHQTSAWVVARSLYRHRVAASANDITRLSGVKRRTVQACLRYLVEAGVVDSVRSGRHVLYVIVENAAAAIDDRAWDLADLPPGIILTAGSIVPRTLKRFGGIPSPGEDLARMRAFRRDQWTQQGVVVVLPIGAMRRRHHDWERRKYALAEQHRIARLDEPDGLVVEAS